MGSEAEDVRQGPGTKVFLGKVVPPEMWELLGQGSIAEWNKRQK